MIRLRLKYVQKKKARGNIYYYFRRESRYIRLPGKPGSTEFHKAYNALLNDASVMYPTYAPMSLGSIASQYQGSPDFAQLAKNTKRAHLIYIDRLVKDIEVRIGSEITTLGQCNIKLIDRATVYAIRDKHQDRPGTAKQIISTLAAIMTFALDRGHIQTNPCRGLKRLKLKEIEPWTAEEIQTIFEHTEKHAPMLNLALYLYLFTGQRTSDVINMMWNHIEDGFIRVKQKKTGKEMNIRLHQVLRKRLAQEEQKSLFIIHNRYKGKFTEDAIRDRFRRVRNDLNLPEHIKPHGLRKNAVNMLLEAGCTEAETSAVTGQTLQIIQEYARKVNRKKLSEAAILKLEKS